MAAQLWSLTTATPTVEKASAFWYRWTVLVVLQIVSLTVSSSTQGQSPEVDSEYRNETLDPWQFPQGESGFFFYAAGKDSAGEQDPVARYDIITQCVFWDKEYELLFQMDDRRRPHLIFVNGHQHSVVHDGENEFPVSIQFVIHQGVFKSQVVKPDSRGVLARSDFSVRSSDFLQQCDADPRVEHPQPSSVIIQCDHRMLYGVSRSAIAHEFFGHPMMQLVVRGDDDLIQLMGGFCANPKSPAGAKLVGLAFRIPDDFLNLVKRGGLATAGDWGESLHLIRQTGGVDGTSTASLIVDAEDVIRLAQGGFEAQVDAFRRCIALTQKSNELVDHHFRQGDAIVLDPVARGFFLEQLAWDDASGASFLLTFAVMLRAFQEREMLFSVTANSASLGLGANPLSLGSLELFFDGNGRPEIRAALAAHWELPTAPGEIDSVAELLASAKLRQTRGDAMDVLILLGAVDRISEQQLATWCQMNLVEASVPLRRRKLAYLMKTPSGRQFLLTKMADGSLPEEVQTLAKSIIGSHVDATKQLKRFDMINEQELQRLEAAL